MQLPFLMPMFDDRAPILGLPAQLIIFVLAGTGLIIGAVAIMRIFRGEPEYRSFRATERRDSILPLLVALLAVGFLAFAAIVAIQG